MSTYKAVTAETAEMADHVALFDAVYRIIEIKALDPKTGMWCVTYDAGHVLPLSHNVTVDYRNLYRITTATAEETAMQGTMNREEMTASAKRNRRNSDHSGRTDRIVARQAATAAAAEHREFRRNARIRAERERFAIRGF